MKHKIILMLVLALLIGTVFVSFGVQKAAAQIQNITLYGGAGLGWGFTQASMSIPGPEVSFEAGVPVNLTLIGVDGLPHNFFVDYNGNRVPDANEPMSPTFTSTINYQFTPDRTGTFTYYCQFHMMTMFGNVNAIPELSTVGIAILLMVVSLIAVAYKFKRRS